MHKKAFLFGHPPYSEARWLPSRQVPDGSGHAGFYRELGWKDFGDQSHYWIGETELGLEFKRTPAELRRLFRWNAAAWAGDCALRAMHEAGRAAGNSFARIRGVVGTPAGPGQRAP